MLWNMFILWPRPQNEVTLIVVVLCGTCLFYGHVPKTKLHLFIFFQMPQGGVSYISKNNVPKCKLHFGEVPKNVSYIYRGPPPIS